MAKRPSPANREAVKLTLYSHSALQRRHEDASTLSAFTTTASQNAAAQNVSHTTINR